MSMPFEKYRGSDQADCRTVICYRLPKCRVARAGYFGGWTEFKERGANDGPDVGHRSLNSDKVTAVYRGLSLEFHPDRGGNTGAMKTINEFYPILTGP
jgi:hypothetical protein